MITRYSRPEMASLFEDQARMDSWLRVEQVVLDVLARDGIAPREAADALLAVNRVDVVRVRAREEVTRHDVAAFVDVLAEDAPGAAGWIHFGLTSSDVVDTAWGLTLGAAGALVLEELEALRATVLQRAIEHRDTLMVGRTHGMPAELITFGAKLAGWWHQLTRDQRRIEYALMGCRAGKLSGAVGTYSGVGPEIEARVLASLGLDRDPSATQIVQRDRLAALLGSFAVLAGTLERIALEIRHLHRAEVGEAHEAFAAGQKGSSAMPHKRNPVVAEQVCGLARVVRANAGVAFENIALWHERDISHSSTERIIVPDTFGLVDHLVRTTAGLVRDLDVDVDRMRDNVIAQRGLLGSQRVLLALVRAGMVRDEAYREVQAAAERVRANPELHLADALASEPNIAAVLGADDVRELCEPSAVPAGIDALFAELAAEGGAQPSD